MANEPNYSSNPSKDEPKKEKVRVIPLEYIDEFPGHPFKVLDDESMAQPSEEVQSESTAAETASCSKAPCFTICENNN